MGYVDARWWLVLAPGAVHTLHYLFASGACLFGSDSHAWCSGAMGLYLEFIYFGISSRNFENYFTVARALRISQHTLSIMCMNNYHACSFVCGSETSGSAASGGDS